MSWDMTQKRHHAVITIDAGLRTRQFTYLGSTITDNLSLDAAIDKRIGVGSLNSCSSHRSSVNKLQAVCEDKYVGIQCLCYQYCMAARHGLHMPGWKYASTCFT